MQNTVLTAIHQHLQANNIPCAYHTSGPVPYIGLVEAEGICWAHHVFQHHNNIIIDDLVTVKPEPTWTTTIIPIGDPELLPKILEVAKC